MKNTEIYIFSINQILRVLSKKIRVIDCDHQETSARCTLIIGHITY
jgi:hypothetical protein